MEKWTTDTIGSQIDKIANVTSANEGAGLEVARERARNGARVIICTEDEEKESWP